MKDDIKKAISIFKEIKEESENPGFVKEVYADTLDDDIVYLVCPTNIICEVLKGRLDYFKESFASRLGLEYHIKLIAKEEFDQIHMDKFGGPSEEQDDGFAVLADQFSGFQVEEIDE